MVGYSLGHYRILSTLGGGGMGEVYAAEDTILKRRVPLKILPAAMASDPERRLRFDREAQRPKIWLRRITSSTTRLESVSCD